MTKDELEKLIETQPPEVRRDAVLLFNAEVTCALNYQASPTSANRKNWEDAKVAFKKFVDDKLSIVGEEPADKPFVSLPEVVEYLQELGWKIKKPTIYVHRREGKITPSKDGTYSIKAVEKYAGHFLKRTATGKRVVDEIEDLQTERLKEEIKLKRTQQEREELILNREKGLLIRLDQVNDMLAGRACVFYATEDYTIQSQAAEWIRLVVGDITKLGLLINTMHNDFGNAFKDYIAPPEYEIFIGDKAQMDIPEDPSA